MGRTSPFSGNVYPVQWENKQFEEKLRDTFLKPKATILLLLASQSSFIAEVVMVPSGSQFSSSGPSTSPVFLLILSGSRFPSSGLSTTPLLLVILQGMTRRDLCIIYTAGWVLYSCPCLSWRIFRCYYSVNILQRCQLAWANWGNNCGRSPKRVRRLWLKSNFSSLSMVSKHVVSLVRYLGQFMTKAGG